MVVFRRLVALTLLVASLASITARAAGALSQPGNDDFADSTWIPPVVRGAALATLTNTLDATSELGEPAGSRSVWYAFASENEVLRIDTCGSKYDTVVEVFERHDVVDTVTGLTDSPMDLRLVARDDNGAACGNGASEVRAWKPGTTLYVRVAAARGSAGGELTLTATGVTNDHFEDAADIAGLDSFGGVRAYGATSQPGEPLLDGVPMKHSTWFKWTAPATRRMSVDLCLGHLGTQWPRVGVFRGTSLHDLEEIGEPARCQLSPQGAVGPHADFAALAGETYWIAVDDPMPLPPDALSWDRYNQTSLWLSPHSTYANEAGAGVTLISPARVLDTRTDGTRLEPHAHLDVAVAGVGSVPTGVSAVAVNLTAVGPTAWGWLRAVRPDAAATATHSNLNFAAGSTRANSAIVPVDEQGRIRIVNGSAGSVDVIVDISAYYRPEDQPQGLNSMQPVRLLDTREDTGLRMGAEDITLGVEEMPRRMRNGAVLQLTVTGGTKAGHLTAFAAGADLPPTSNLNWRAGETISNRVIVPTDEAGRVTLHHGGGGSVHVIVDQVGWVGTTSQSVGGFHAVDTARLLDTRDNRSPLRQQETRRVPVAGRFGIPTSEFAPAMPQAVLLNVTVTNTTSEGWLAAYSALGRPPTSDLNWVQGETRANLVYAPLAPDGTVSFYNAWGTTDLVLDVLGWTD